MMRMFLAHIFDVFDTVCLFYNFPVRLLFGVAILVHNPKRFNQSTWPQLSEVESASESARIFATSDATCADTN